MVEDERARLGVMMEDEGAELDDTVEHVGAEQGDKEQGMGTYETSEDETEDTAQQGGSGNPAPIPRQNLSSKGTGVRKRVASDSSSSSNASSRDGDSIKDTHGKIDDKTIRAKRRRQSGRQDDVLERHRPGTTPSPLGARGVPRARDGARDTTGKGPGKGDDRSGRPTRR